MGKKEMNKQMINSSLFIENKKKEFQSECMVLNCYQN